MLLCPYLPKFILYFVLTRLFMQTVARPCLYKAWSPWKQSCDQSPLLECFPLSLCWEQGRVGADSCGSRASAASPRSAALGSSSRLKGKACLSYFFVCMCMYLFFDIFNQELSLHRAVEMWDVWSVCVCVYVGGCSRESWNCTFFLSDLCIPQRSFFPDFVSLEAPGVRINFYIGQAEEAGNMFVCS